MITDSPFVVPSSGFEVETASTVNPAPLLALTAEWGWIDNVAYLDRIEHLCNGSTNALTGTTLLDATPVKARRMACHHWDLHDHTTAANLGGCGCLSG